jgi:hypothetical protein
VRQSVVEQVEGQGIQQEALENRDQQNVVLEPDVQQMGMENGQPTNSSEKGFKSAKKKSSSRRSTG